MSPSESPDPADSSAMGFYTVLKRVHTPFLDALFWLALGCVLGWQDTVCVVQRHEQEGKCKSGGRAKPSSPAGE
jgi:hypothetical protein